MKIVIIGAKGMLGSMLGAVFEYYKPLLWDKEEIDITNQDAVRTMLRESAADLVINAAAYTAVDAAEQDQDTAFLVNEMGVKNLATVVKEMSATLVHFSTDYVFPGTQTEGYAEADSPGPAVNVYGNSKLAGERAIKESGCNFYLVRTAWLYGPNGKNFVDTMLHLAQTNKTLNVVHDQFGCPTYTKDVAECVKKLWEEKYPFGIYHAVNSGHASWFEFAQKIFEYTPTLAVVVKPVPSSEFPRPAKRPAYSILKNTKMASLRPWQDALAEYIRSM